SSQRGADVVRGRQLRQIGGAAVFAVHGGHLVALGTVLSLHFGAGLGRVEAGQLVVADGPKIHAGLLVLDQFGLHFRARAGRLERRLVDGDVVGTNGGAGESGESSDDK